LPAYSLAIVEGRNMVVHGIAFDYSGEIVASA
jgi:hypothetical protein